MQKVSEEAYSRQDNPIYDSTKYRLAEKMINVCQLMLDLLDAMFDVTLLLPVSP